MASEIRVDSLKARSGLGTVTFSSSGQVLTGITTAENLLLTTGGTSTGTTNQTLQVTGGAYVSGSVGIGTTNPAASSKLNVYGEVRVSGGTTNVGGEQNLVVQSSNANTIPSTVSTADSNGTLQIFGGGLGAGSSRGGQIDFVAGAATTNPGTLIFRAGTASGGTSQPEVARFNASGNLGIGTTNPVDKLHVFDTVGEVSTFESTTTEVALRLKNSTAGNVYLFNKDNNNFVVRSGGVAGSETLRVTSTSVGIGTTNPNGILQVGAASTQAFTITSTGQVIINDTTGISGTNTSPLIIKSTGAGSTTAPQILLGTLSGTNPALIGFTNAASGTMYVGRTNSGGIFGVSASATLNGGSYADFIGNTGSVPLLFVTNNTEAMRINSSQQVGIGTTNPTQSLHVQGSSRVTGARYDSSNSAGTSGQVLQSTATGTQWINVSSVSGAVNGITIRDEGSTVGTAGSVTSLNFVGGNIVATASGAGATITIADNLVGTGLSITGGISTVGFLTASSVFVGGASTITSLFGTSANYTNLSATNLYAPTGVVTSLTGTSANYTNLSATNLYAPTGIVTNISGFSLNYSGLSTVSSLTGTSANYTNLSATNVYGVTGIVTNISGTNLNYSGITTLGIITATQLFSSGIVTASRFTSTVAQGTAPLSVGSSTIVTNLNVDYLDGFDSLYYTNASNLSSGTVPSARITASSGDFTVGQNLYVTGTLSVGGTSIILNAATLQIKDRDIVLGITTNANNADVSTDSTATHGGVSIASTQGSPIFDMPQQVGINSLPSTYKQFMWISSATAGAFSGVSTDAWISNYAIGIGTLTVRNSSRLTVGAGFTVFDTYLDAQEIRSRSIYSIGIVTATGQFQSTQANNTADGGGQIYLNGATGNRIDFNPNGAAAPTFTTRSVGTKIVLYPGVAASGVDFGFGIESSTLWSSVGTTSNQFKWYAGITNIATLFGTGELVLGTTTKTGTASQTLQVTGGASFTGVGASVGIGTAAPSQTLHVQGSSRVTGARYDSSNSAGVSGQVLQSTGSGTGTQWVNISAVGGVSGITIRDEGTTLGTAGSVTSINFVGGNIVATASGAGATITIADNLVGTGLSITGGISTVGFLTASSVFVSGTSTITSLVGTSANYTNLSASNLYSPTGIVTNISGTNLNYIGIATFTNGPVLIGSATSTGSADQRLQVTGHGYVSGSVGIGTTNPSSKLTVNANATLTNDLVYISNIGFPATTAGLNNLQIDYVGGAAAVEAGAVRVGMTPGTTSGGIWNSFRILPTASATTGVIHNALKCDAITAGLGTDNALYVGTGWDNIINYNNTSIINGIGQFVGTINTTSGISTIGFLTATSVFVSGTSTITSLVGTSANYTNLSATNFYAPTGVVTSLSGTSANYTNGSFTNGYINVGIITSLSGTSANYTNGSFTNGYINVGIVTSLSGTSANYTNLSATNLYAPTGIVTNISGNNLNYIGISTLKNTTIIGGGTSTGTTGQVLQVTGITSSVYIGGSVGLGTTNPTGIKLDVVGNARVSGIVTFTQSATDVFNINVNGSPTTDMMNVTNTGFPVTVAGVNALSVTYVGGAAAVESSATRTDLTPGTTSGGTWSAFRVVPTASATTGVVQNAVKCDSITAGVGTDNALWVGTGWDSIISYNNTSIINGIGEFVGRVNSSLGVSTISQLDITGNATANDSVLYLSGTVTSSSGTNGLFGIGALNFSDTDIIADFTHNVNSYAQLVVQNKNSGSSASADIIVNNDRSAGTTYYGDFGINATTFAGSGPFQDPDGTYLYASGGTLAVGTNDAKDFRIATGSATATPVTRMTITGIGGSVGIGTTNPDKKLHVFDSLSTVSTFESTNASNASNIRFVNTQGNSVYVGSIDGNNFYWNISGAERARLTSSGNLGIGTTNPSVKLQVSGGDVTIDRGSSIQTLGRNLTIGGARNGSGANFANLNFSNYDTGGGAVDYNAVRLRCFTPASGATNGGVLTIETAPNSSATSLERVRVFDTGEVGINTTILTGTASQPLQVTGGAYVSGNLGVGATNPLTKLDSRGTILVATNSNGNNLLAFGNSTAFGPLNGAPDGSHGNSFILGNSSTASGAPSYLSFWTTSGGTVVERARIDSSGNLGIGIANPTQSLHVQGNARVTGAVYDSTNSPGTSGQVLQSTVTGTQWTTAAAGGGGSGKFDTTIDNVLYIQPTGTLDIVGVGTTTSQITTLPAGSNEYIIHSLHVTNVSNGDAEITAGFVINARKVPASISVSVGSSGGPGIHTITVGSASSITVGMAVTGTGNIGETTGIGTTAGFQYNTYVTSVDGNNITLSKPMSGYATGVLYFSPVSKVSSRLPVPVGSAVELLKQPMVLNALDSIVLQSTGAGSGIGSTSTNTVSQTANSNFLTVTAGAAITNFLTSGMLIQPTGSNTGIQTNTFVGVGYIPGSLTVPMTKPATVSIASTSISFTEVVVPEDGALQVTAVYQSTTDTAYNNGTGTVVGIVTLASLASSRELGITSTTPSVYYATGNTYPSIIQSIRVTNISDGAIYPGGDYPVSVGIGNSDTVFSWLAYNMVIPKNSSIELCEAPKRIGIGQSIFASSPIPGVIEIQVAGKQKTS